MRHHFQGKGQYIATFDLSEGLANQKKNANFEVCFTLDRVVSSTVPIEILELNLVSCQPITALKNLGPADEKNFVLLEFPIPSELDFSLIPFVDISGSYVVVNPAGQPMAGPTHFEVELVPLDFPPPTCSEHGTPNSAGGCDCDPGFGGPLCDRPADCTELWQCSQHGVCVADNTCQCDPGYGSQPNCSEPPSDCSGHGTADPTTGTCTCDSGYGGEFCERPPDCSEQNACHSPNGFCTGDNTCQCHDGWGGVDCSVPDDSCRIVKNPDGSASAQGTCENPNDECRLVLAALPNTAVAVCIPPPPTCVPAAELCDGVDNDCDNEVDEGFGLGELCSVGVGVCQRDGVVVCDSTGGSVCGASPGDSSEEVCDGLDNDCDGIEDEGNPGGGVSCDGPDSDFCNEGVTQCSNGSLFCDDTSSDNVEVCDGVDNDCDGSIDGDVCVPIGFCGDGLLDPGEECDDGNNNDGDGCSATCRLETGPTVETDSYSLSEVQMTVEFPFGDIFETVTLRGPTTIEARFPGPLGSAGDTNGDGLEDIQTEIVAMNLVGTGPSLGTVVVSLNPDFNSLGIIEENSGLSNGQLDLPPFGTGTGESFYNVWIMIDFQVGDLDPFRVINQVPIPIQSTVTFKPVAPGETLRSPIPIPMVDTAGGTTGIIIWAFDYTPEPTP